MTAILYFFYFLSLYSPGITPATMSSASNLQSDTIYWSPSNKLIWNDFQAKDLDKLIYENYDSSKYRILAHSKIDFTLSFKLKEKKPIILSNVFFIKSKSWTSTYSYEDLKHEQGHFDMAEIYARTFNSEMLKYKDLEIQEFIKLAYEKYNISRTSYNDETIKFDMATKTSLGLELYLKEIKKRLEESEVKTPSL